MTSANALAWAPVVIACPASSLPFERVGASGVAVMFCSAIASRTSFRPSIPIAIAPMPNATRIGWLQSLHMQIAVASPSPFVGRYLTPASSTGACLESARPLNLSAGNYRSRLRLQPEADVEARQGAGTHG